MAESSTPNKKDDSMVMVPESLMAQHDLIPNLNQPGHGHVLLLLLLARILNSDAQFGI